MLDNVPKTDAQELTALRELLDEAIAKVTSTRQVVIRTDIAGMSCKQLVSRIIDERGEQAAAVLATKLNGLGPRGKARVLLRPARNGNGVHVRAELYPAAPVEPGSRARPLYHRRSSWPSKMRVDPNKARLSALIWLSCSSVAS